MKTKKPGLRADVAPTVTVLNRQKAVRVPLKVLEEFARPALRACLGIPSKQTSGLAGLAELSVVLVSDRRMAELHRRFLQLPGPTDVITFQHGEIFISAETARRNARRFGNSLQRELCLYIAHGFLHLHGFDDKDSAGAARMARAQEKLVAAFL
ncbi:MAG: rRNA maturation RNase YbeY [Verrucomicrobia bacterium]|nr:MAG: rRNA maturation RNase YbeY [Verrucomicrobiota bacterium]